LQNQNKIGNNHSILEQQIEKALKEIVSMEFVTKHQKRDSKLLGHLQIITTAMEKDLTNDDDVLAVFYGGSLGKGDYNLYSDIDLRIVVKPDMFDQFILRKNNRPHKWGKVLFIEDVSPMAPYSIVHFDCFVKADIFYYKPQDLHPSVWLQNIKIVYDPNQIVSLISSKSLSVSYEVTIEEFERWRSKFFAYLHDAYRRVMKKEYYYAIRDVDMMRWSIASGWNMEANRIPNNPGDWSRYEGERSVFEEWQRSLLESWDCNRDPNRIMNVIKCMIPEFKRIHKHLCNKLNINEDPEWVKRIVDMVL
jgi:predicted nucleotidyltransferase